VAQRLDGTYLLTTDRDDISGDEAWRIYTLPTRAEDAFRDMKSPLCVATSGVTGGCDHLENLGMPQCVLADREEDGLRAMLCQRIEHGACVVGPRTVVKSEHDFLEQQEVVRPILL
jgi:hypothetical protein